jgi:hypothetical protein
MQRWTMIARKENHTEDKGWMGRMGGDNRDAFSSPRKKGGSCRRIPFELRTGMPRKEIALQTKEGTEGKRDMI